ncbi:hypothetical protein [Flagellimonas sediminis]|uniref:Uncharacterized protein n=1 Tax=Flagellimonas sediminis TaxID=2696468 RepID=A0A6I5L433_9FLAO|nr:hypothetical protein [Allomuricauda sediminis]NDV44818.1 hypothetical protein [Allomuricauda sediminis]
MYENATKLRSDNFTLGFRKLLGDSHVIYAELTYGRVEFQTDTFDDQYSIKLGYIKRL